VKTTRIPLILLVLLTCFQLTGLEEAFCEDSAAETGCEQCATCAGHSYTTLPGRIFSPSIVLAGYSTLDHFLRVTEQPPFSLLRPPIVLS
jgi:hypothetical protein